jgi:hypothetical protein
VSTIRKSTKEAAHSVRAGRLDGAGGPPRPLPEDRERYVAPPLAHKVHPHAEMDRATPSLDDERRRYHAGATAFGFDPEAGDAAADMAGEMGQSFLEGATRGEDPSDLQAMKSDAEEGELQLLIEGEEALDADEEPEGPPTLRRR